MTEYKSMQKLVQHIAIKLLQSLKVYDDQTIVSITHLIPMHQSSKEVNGKRGNIFAVFFVFVYQEEQASSHHRPRKGIK